MDERIGVYICECGPNIKEQVYTDELVDFSGKLGNVVFAKPFDLLCGDEGKELIENDIKEHNINRVVIAACSPKEHEATFKKVLHKAGLNPFLLQIANIREHCAWVIRDKDKATDVAKSAIKAAIYRVVHHEALETKEIDCQPHVLVIGAGVSGISASLVMAQKQRQVYLVEKSACIGGRVNRYDEVFHNLECAPCMLEHDLDVVLHNDQIEVLTLSEVKEILGSYGNFTAIVNKKARYVDIHACIGCGACVEVCPVSVKNEYNEGLNERKAIDFPYQGALPYVPFIDKENCLRFKGEECNECETNCAFAAINFSDEDETRELSVGAILIATGFDLFDCRKAEQFGYGKIDDVYTGFEFERIVSSTGPTGGEILKKDGEPPKEIAMIHCVGSRNKDYHEYCSGICCSYLTKFSYLIKKKLPEANIIDIYSRLCLPGKKSETFFNKLDKENISFIKVRDTHDIKISKENGKISLTYPDGETHKLNTVKADMVVLAPAMEGCNDNEILSKVIDLSLEKGNFFEEEHAKMSPVSTTSEGIFIAGCAQGPQDVPSSVAQSVAAAGKIISKLIPGEKLVLDPCVSKIVNEDNCSGCKTCISGCPYKAITFDEDKKQARINEVLCRGCGVCVVTCPSSLIVGQHFTDKQIYQEIKGVLE